MTHSTSEPSFAKLAQVYLYSMGLYRGKVDGFFGPVSETAYHQWLVKYADLLEPPAPPRVIPAVTAPHWPVIRTDDDGSIVFQTSASWFGGTNDPMDNGQTASGRSTREPGVLGCALPLAVEITGRRVPACAGSPLPPLPWGTLVEVTFPNGRTIQVPLLDVGPDTTLGRGLDLTQAAFVVSGQPLSTGIIHGVTVRILKGVVA